MLKRIGVKFHVLVDSPLFTLVLVVLGLLVYRNLFTVDFFADDFFHLVHAQQPIVKLISPVRDYFFRPVSTEFFYWLIQTTNHPLFAGHLVGISAFLFFLFFLYKSVRQLTQSRFFSLLTLSLVLIHPSRVYQLYWLATTQEILCAMFLSVSFYLLLVRRIGLALVFYFCAILSKETALMFLPFMFMFEYFFPKAFNLTRQNRVQFIAVTLLGLLLVLPGLMMASSQLQEYTVRFSISTIVNNMVWYVLWSVGLPSIMPDYLPSLFSSPIPTFYEYFNNTHFVWYWRFFGSFVLSLVLTLMLVMPHILKHHFKSLLFSLASFSLFILPSLFIQHKWQVRLLLPSIFTALCLSGLMLIAWKKSFILKILSILTLCFYFGFSYFLIQFHEEVSAYFLESQIVKTSQNYFSSLDSGTIYLADSKEVENIGWQGSKKLFVTYNDQNFFRYTFPEKNFQIVYGFKSTAPANTLIVQADEILY